MVGIAPKPKNTDSDNLNISKNGHEVLAVRKKAVVLNLVRKEKKSYADIVKMCNMLRYLETEYPYSLCDITLTLFYRWLHC